MRGLNGRSFAGGMVTGLLFRSGKLGKALAVGLLLLMARMYVWWSALPGAVRFLSVLAALVGLVLLIERWSRPSRQRRGRYRPVPVRRRPPVHERVDELTFLYRWWDADGTLLYVGITNDLERRSRQHAEKSWMHPGVTSTVEAFPSRGEALEAEARAIWREAPRWNIIHNGGRR